jgi:D-alanine-D-alanine ligase
MNFKVKKSLRTIVLVHESLVPPDRLEDPENKDTQPWKTEYDVIHTLRDMGHEVYPVGVHDDLGVIRKAIDEHRPQVAFNLLEEFHGYSLYDQHVVSYLELLRLPYTGCNPRGLTIAHDKALSKKILAYHRILVPGFVVFPLNRKVHRPHRLKFPLLVKSISEEGSVGIAQASVVYDDEKLIERVEFIHRQTSTHAIAEQYIEGREIYVAVIGNQQLQAYKPWELLMENLPEGSANIATSKVKWDRKYQKKIGLVTQAANLTSEQEKRVIRLSKRIYRLLGLSGYARLDYRLTSDGQFYLLEANPNPDISEEEDFAEAAKYSGVNYRPLLQKLITLGLSYNAFG